MPGSWNGIPTAERCEERTINLSVVAWVPCSRNHLPQLSKVGDLWISPIFVLAL